MLFVMYSYIRQQLFYSDGPVSRLIPKQYMDYAIIVRGHVSDVLFSLSFYEHFTFFAENYSLNGTELNIFQSHLGLRYLTSGCHPRSCHRGS